MVGPSLETQMNNAAKFKKAAAPLQEVLTSLEPVPFEIDRPPRRPPRKPTEVAELRRLVILERKAGMRVAEIARHHGVSEKYVYRLSAKTVA